MRARLACVVSTALVVSAVWLAIVANMISFGIHIGEELGETRECATGSAR